MKYNIIKWFCSYCCWLGMAATAPAQGNWMLEAGSGFRAGIWEYNLGNQGESYGTEGLHYTHFSPFIPFYLEAGRQFPSFRLAVGGSYTLFFDNEMRVHQNGSSAYQEYTIAPGLVQFLHLYTQVAFYPIKKAGFKLGPQLGIGYFNPLTGHPDESDFGFRHFLEPGLSLMLQIKQRWLHIRPVYQINAISSKSKPFREAGHRITSIGVLLGFQIY
ncbi:MAG TPA: hypothetical protein PKA00_11930 [Saprospiraceae bacterium]|nr:hypothetical protein [Saprospiraceae bacterium]HMQ83614.1 hypothetical protein [Saprospiraceae bacterium]